jgi:hypothetical protein
MMISHLPSAKLFARLLAFLWLVSSLVASAVGLYTHLSIYWLMGDIVCGNTIMGNNRPVSASTCSMTCAGDSSQQCGGRDAIDIYVKDSYPFTVGPAAVLDSYNGYSKTQCWQYVRILLLLLVKLITSL